MEKKAEFDWIRRSDGTSEFEDFLDGLPNKDSAKLLSVIHNAEIEGITVAIKMKWVKKLETDLYELRSKCGNNIQRALYFRKIGSQYVITHGFTKKSEATPETEKQHARNARQRYTEETKNEQHR
jgi:phage-related protein